MLDHNRISIRLSKIKASHGYRGVAKFGVRWVQRNVLLPLAMPFIRLKARFAVDTVKHYNDFFFRELGIERAEAEDLYRDTMAKSDLPPLGQDSFHRLAFAALAVSGFRPTEILEIGTADGQTTRFLATLFPEARVHTVNLPTTDPVYYDWHPEGEAEHEAALIRRLDLENIDALRVNSAWLMAQDLPEAFDLIWVDGGHEFPNVAWDHFFAMQRVAEDGWIFSDDIIRPSDATWWQESNLDPDKVISYYNERQPGTFRLLLKSMSPVHYVQGKKFIAYCHHGAAPSPQSTEEAPKRTEAAPAPEAAPTPVEREASNELVGKAFSLVHDPEMRRKLIPFLRHKAGRAINRIRRLRYAMAAVLQPTIRVNIGGGDSLRFQALSRSSFVRARSVVSKEPDTVEWISGFDRGVRFWDIGANIGTFSLFAAKTRGAQVLAFEPLYSNFYNLTRNVEVNELTEQISTFCTAFTDKTRMDDFYIRGVQAGYSGNSFGAPRDDMGEQYVATHRLGVAGFAIDDFIDLFQADVPHHIKIDVDGIELEILQGARTTLGDPTLQSVLVEIQDARAEVRDAALALMEEAGFEITHKKLNVDDPVNLSTNYIFARRS